MKGNLISKSADGRKAQIVVKGLAGQGSRTYHCLKKDGNWFNKDGKQIEVK